jgi:hypothetical protein
MQQESVLAYARKHAAVLRLDMKWRVSGDRSGYWEATSPELRPTIAARAAAALEFFRQYSGADSVWTLRANAIYNNQAAYNNEGDRQSQESGARALGDLLLAWAEQVDEGITEIVGTRAWDEVSVASTDLMSQVRRLVTDGAAHPAAAIVLCGAALEIALRAVVEARGLPMPERPTMSTLTGVLRQAELLTKQDTKDFEMCGGLRNSAAHGQFEDLSPERAGLMEQQTNLLLQRLASLQVGGSQP